MSPIACFCLLAVAGFLRADPGIAIGLVGVAGQTEPVREPAVFGGRTVPLILAATAQLGGHATLSADLIQLAEGLGAETAGKIPIGEADFATATSRTLRAKIPLPQVRFPTRFLVRFFAQSPGSQASITAGQVVLRVYPPLASGTIRRVLAESAEKSGSRLAIFGASPALREYCESHGVEFRDLGPAIPEQSSGDILALGEVSAADWSDKHPGPQVSRAVVFIADALAPPGIFRTLRPGGSLTKVTLPLLAGLADHPENQHLMLDLLAHELNPDSPQFP